MTTFPAHDANPPRADRSVFAGRQATGEDRLLFLLALAALGGGIALRLILFPARPNLWEDEIIAATHAVQPLVRLLVNVIRNDVHPPLYFLQLHAWSGFGRSDVWLIGNSLLWSFAALASLWLVVHRLTGDRLQAMTATAFLALLPAAVTMSHELRMYAMLSTMVIWAYYLAHRGFAEDRRRERWLLAGLALLIVYTHAIGFISVLFNGIYALASLARRRAPARDYGRWLALYGGVGVLSLPMLVSNMLHDANLPGLGGMDAALVWLASSMLDDGVSFSRIQFAAGLALCAWVLGGGLANRQSRLATFAFVAAPLLLAVLVSVTLKPIFKANYFATVLSPFVALTLAQLLPSLGGRTARRAAFAAIAAVLGLVSADHDRLVPKATDFPAVAAVIRAELSPGDVVYAPQMSMFWGMAWNLAGPDWGSPLEIANPPNPQWAGVYRRLGPKLVDLLDLMPHRQSLDAGGITLLVGADSLAAAERAPRLWLVTYPRVDLPAGLPAETLGGLRRVSARRFGNDQLQLTLYARPR